jgi:DNA polymerase elongation subunit (family B)
MSNTLLDLSKLSNDELLKYKKRLEYDISQHTNTELARKIQLNSAYGACGNQYFRYYDIRLAESVTKSGQLTIKWIEKALNKFLNDFLKTIDQDYVLAIDTDSVYLSLEKVVSRMFDIEQQKNVNKVVDFLDKFCEKVIQPVIDCSFEELEEYLNASVNCLKMKREVLADGAIWTTKKRYVMNVIDKEGVRYHVPELKMMGLEAIRTTIPSVCRERIKEALRIILSGTEEQIHKYIEDFRQHFNTLKPEDIAFPRTVNGLDKYSSSTDLYVKHTPIHVKASLLYNFKLKELNINKKYEPILEGNKMKFIYLKEPNYLKDSVIGFVTILPEEFELHNFIDFSTQFDKTFMEPLNLVLSVVGWRDHAPKTLDMFFMQ